MSLNNELPFSGSAAKAIAMLGQQTDSLRPTFRWEAFQGLNVTYDLVVWHAGPRGPDAVVYSRSDLAEPSHTLESSLEPSKAYFWSVRAHFSKDGRDRITEWSHRSVRTSLVMKVMSMGMLALYPDPVDDGFYVFVTPEGARSPQAAERHARVLTG